MGRFENQALAETKQQQLRESRRHLTVQGPRRGHRRNEGERAPRNRPLPLNHTRPDRHLLKKASRDRMDGTRPVSLGVQTACYVSDAFSEKCSRCWRFPEVCDEWKQTSPQPYCWRREPYGKVLKSTPEGHLLHTIISSASERSPECCFQSTRGSLVKPELWNMTTRWSAN